MLWFFPFAFSTFQTPSSQQLFFRITTKLKGTTLILPSFPLFFPTLPKLPIFVPVTISNPDKNHKKIMAQAGQVKLPPGLTERRTFAFDFAVAVQSVRDKLPDTFREALWQRTLQTALEQTTDQLKSRGMNNLVSLLPIQVCFVDKLWTQVCKSVRVIYIEFVIKRFPAGLAGPPSPWKQMLQSINWEGSHGFEGRCMLVQSWVRIFEQLKKEGNTVCTIATGWLCGTIKGTPTISIYKPNVVEKIIKEHACEDEEDDNEVCLIQIYYIRRINED